MIYQHYKGGVYFVEGFAHTHRDASLPEGAEFFGAAHLIHGDDLFEADVFSVKELRTDFHCLLIRCDQAEGAYVFYTGQDGRKWLRPQAEFFNEATEGVNRFRRLLDQEVFALLMRAKTR